MITDSMITADRLVNIGPLPDRIPFDRVERATHSIAKRTYLTGYSEEYLMAYQYAFPMRIVCGVDHPSHKLRQPDRHSPGVETSSLFEQQPQLFETDLPGPL